MSALEEPQPPDAVYVRQNWIPIGIKNWVEECNRILLEYGCVNGARTYRTKHQARYQPRKLRKYMVDLRLHEPWQLKEHVGQVPEGWVWSLEYIPKEPK